jgi:hypothetical protein
MPCPQEFLLSSGARRTQNEIKIIKPGDGFINSASVFEEVFHFNTPLVEILNILNAFLSERYRELSSGIAITVLTSMVNKDFHCGVCLSTLAFAFVRKDLLRHYHPCK